MKRFLIIVTGLAVAALAPAAAAQSPDDRNVYRGMNPQIVDAAKATSPDDRPLPRGTTPPPDFVDRYVARVSRYGAPGDIHPDDQALPRSTPVELPTLVRVSDRGFDWTDFGVGAIGGFGIALSLLGTALLVLRRSLRRARPA
jgi:hypothetical protein